MLSFKKGFDSICGYKKASDRIIEEVMEHTRGIRVQSRRDIYRSLKDLNIPNCYFITNNVYDRITGDDSSRLEVHREYCLARYIQYRQGTSNQL